MYRRALCDWYASHPCLGTIPHSLQFEIDEHPRYKPVCLSIVRRHASIVVHAM